jgi:hypothetical protein
MRAPGATSADETSDSEEEDYRIHCLEGRWGQKRLANWWALRAGSSVHDVKKFYAPHRHGCNSVVEDFVEGFVEKFSMVRVGRISVQGLAGHGGAVESFTGGDDREIEFLE